MSRLIEDLLDVARIEAGAFVVRPSAEEPISVLEEVRDMFEVQADEAQVSLTVGPVSDVLVHMDHDRVVQALANLVDNALRFTPEGGMITLSGEAQMRERCPYQFLILELDLLRTRWTTCSVASGKPREIGRGEQDLD